MLLCVLYIKNTIRSNQNKPVDVEPDAADSNEDHQNIKNVPETLEVLQLVLLDL